MGLSSRAMAAVSASVSGTKPQLPAQASLKIAVTVAISAAKRRLSIGRSRAPALLRSAIRRSRSGRPCVMSSR